MLQSALGVPVPEAESLVKDLRERYDPTAAVGGARSHNGAFPVYIPRFAHR